MGRIVVGVDGSEHGLRALAWAAAEARLRGDELEMVTVSPPELLPTSMWVEPDAVGDLSAAAKHVQEVALASLGPVDDLVLEQTTAVGAPADVLLERGEGADLVVLGARGLGVVRGALLGSIARQVAMHATGPVAVVPDAVRHHGRVAVGVDGSEHSIRALRWAQDHARVHDATLEAVAVQPWTGVGLGTPWLPYAPAPVDTGQLRERLRQELDETVDRVTGDETVVRTVVEGPVARSLLGRAEDADVLVVGHRGLGGFERLLLGSVASRCIAHASVPVVVVPQGR